MWRLDRTDTFVRTARRYLKRRPHLAGAVRSALERLTEDPFHSTLRTHGLKGRFTGLHSASVTYKVRLVFELHEDEKRIILVDIGDHDMVYR